MFCLKISLEILLVKYKNRCIILAQVRIKDKIVNKIDYNMRLRRQAKENQERGKIENMEEKCDVEIIHDDLLQALIYTLNEDCIEACIEACREL